MIPMLSFAEPHRLWLLVVPAIIGICYLILGARRGRRSRNLTRLDLVIPPDSSFKRHISVLLALLSIVSLVLAYAKPQDLVDVPRERATIVIAIDVSRSMMAEDIQPNRLVAAKDAADQFVDSLPRGFNVALVSFAGTAALVSPPTTDRAAVKRAINSLELQPATAIGEGIYTSLDALALAPKDPDAPDDAAPGAIVLLSDGSTNIGRSSAQAAEEAKKRNVPIYTIAYGTDTGYVVEDGVRVPVPVDHAELAEVAKISGGKKYSASSVQDLRTVYETLARAIGYEKEEAEVTQRFALYALVCAVLASAGVISLAARWP